MPGEIGHGDWWEPPLVVPVGKNRTRQVYGFVSTLPHCAAHAVVFSFHKTTPDFLEGLIGCLKRLGGVPDKFVVDNDSSIVEPRRPRAPAQLHDEVAALFGHLCCLPVVLDPGKPQSKAFASHCTSWRRFDEHSLRESAAHAFDESAVPWDRRLKEPLVLVVGFVGDKEPGAMPGLDGRGVHPEPFGHLAEGEQSPVSQALGVTDQAVSTA